MNWPFALRCLLIGLLFAAYQVASTIMVMDNAPSNWEAVKLIAAAIIAGIGGGVAYGRDPERALGGLMGKAGKVAMVLLLLVPLAGCSGLAVLNQNNTSEQQVAIMQQQNARGCVFFYGSAAPWATVKTVIVGTWGSDPPPYAECWQSLPNGF